MKKSLLLILLISWNADIKAYDYLREQLREELIASHWPITDWKISKRAIFQKIHLEKDKDEYFIKDVYCHKIISQGVSPHSMPDNKIINVEHTWPQSKFPKKKSIVQKSDLHHLYPVDSKANSKRGNYPFGEFENQGAHRLLECEASKLGRIPSLRMNAFEPPLNQKGNVARALFYFAVRYNGQISDYEELVLKQWNILDPVDDSELKRNNIIETLQGNRNPFIDDPNLANQIFDF